MTYGEFQIADRLDDACLPQLVALFGGAWWTKSRSVEDVQAILRGSDLVFAPVDIETDRLIGFARVLTDFHYLAIILDVVVAEGSRKTGLGAALLEAIVNHPPYQRSSSAGEP